VSCFMLRAVFDQGELTGAEFFRRGSAMIFESFN
jgi:hypothetical protein